MTKHTRSGFSMLELSIAILAISFIVGATFAGRNLVNAAKLRSVISEEQNYLAIIQAFKDQYHFYPGDMPNAYSFWGAACGASAAACNGSGDGIIPPVAYDSDYTHVEALHAWVHLSLAKMIPGNYTGIALGGSVAFTPLNSPTAKFQPGQFTALWGFFSEAFAAWTTPTYLFSTRRNLLIGGEWAWSPMNSIFTPTQAYNIDLKIDDGLPQDGKMWAINGTTYFSGTGKTAIYDNFVYEVPVHVLAFEVP